MKKWNTSVSSWTFLRFPSSARCALPVRRIFCVGRNYVEHQKENGRGRPRAAVLLHQIGASNLVPEGGKVHFPADDIQLPLGRPRWSGSRHGGYKIPGRQGQRSRLGLRSGPRHDPARSAAGRKRQGQALDLRQDFDQSAPVGPNIPASKSGHPKKGKLWLKVNGSCARTLISTR